MQTEQSIFRTKSRSRDISTSKNMNEIHKVMATSFADDADLAAYRRAKAKGMSDQQAFKLGDNGVGCWGDSCASGSGPRCALPPEDGNPLIPNARGAKVRVVRNIHDDEGNVIDTVSVICELRDTMPHKAHIENGAGIDLNPDAWKALRGVPPCSHAVTWQFV